MQIEVTTVLAGWLCLVGGGSASAASPQPLACEGDDKVPVYTDLHLIADGDSSLDTGVLLFRLCRAFTREDDFEGKFRQIRMYGDASAVATLYGQRASNTLASPGQENANLAFWNFVSGLKSGQGCSVADDEPKEAPAAEVLDVRAIAALAEDRRRGHHCAPRAKNTYVRISASAAHPARVNVQVVSFDSEWDPDAKAFSAHLEATLETRMFEVGLEQRDNDGSLDPVTRHIVVGGGFVSQRNVIHGSVAVVAPEWKRCDANPGMACVHVGESFELAARADESKWVHASDVHFAWKVDCFDDKDQKVTAVVLTRREDDRVVDVEARRPGQCVVSLVPWALDAAGATAIEVVDVAAPALWTEGPYSWATPIRIWLRPTRWAPWDDPTAGAGCDRWRNAFEQLAWIDPATVADFQDEVRERLIRLFTTDAHFDTGL